MTKLTFAIGLTFETIGTGALFFALYKIFKRSSENSKELNNRVYMMWVVSMLVSIFTYLLTIVFFNPSSQAKLWA
jgi:hypothetical protein